MAHRHEGEDGAYSLQVFVWPAGTRTKIHDHSSWGAYCCAIGSVLEERYERLDDSDSSRPDHARLKKRSGNCRGAARTGPRPSSPLTGASTG